MTVRLGELVAALGGRLAGDPDQRIEALASLTEGGPGSISFLANPRYLPQLASTRASCVIVSPAQEAMAVERGAAIVVDDPYLYFARLTQWWAARQRPAPMAGVHPGAMVDPTAKVSPHATVGAGAVIAAGAQVHAEAVIGALTVIGQGAVVGRGTRLAPRVSLLDGCRIGERGIVHSGAVIGADGFGFARDNGQWVKIEQLGCVRIGDDVEIGANTCIDRGALGDTVIGDGVKLDNLIQIGHNVHIGNGTAIAGCVGIAGSTRIGAHCTIAGGAGIAGHLVIADHVHVAANATVTHSLLRAGTYGGFFPLGEAGSWEKNAVLVRQLQALRDRIRQLERSLSSRRPPESET